MTPNPIPDSPILRLNQDLLWSIFALNADMFSAPLTEALRNTWSTSQVCKLWRDFMLTTPSLWGRLIDIDAFSKSADDWAQEVLQRSGSAVLWIKANYVTDWGPLFFDILKKYWHRIQRLVISISPGDFKQIPRDQFYLPAPHLQVFELNQFWEERSKYKDVFHSWPTRPLFADNAPALRKFHFAEYRFDTYANWLSGISSLHIGHPFSVQEMLLILQRTPNLHYLCVDSLAVVTGTPQSLPYVDVYLPNLSHCILYSNFESSIALLGRLDMPSACHLQFHPNNYFSATDVSEDFLKSSFKLLSTFAQRYLQSDQSRRLRLVLFYSIDYFSWSLRDDTSLHHHAFQILVCMQPELFPLIFDEFSFPQLSKVTELDLSFVDDPISTEAVLPILSYMSSIKFITLDMKAFGYLVLLHRDIKQRGDISPLIFPNLEIMDIDAIFTSKNTYLLNRDDGLHELLKFRAHRGHVVKVVDLTRSYAILTPPLQYLEEMHGLHVLWTDEHSGKVLDYECGSGHPETLPSSFRKR